MLIFIIGILFIASFFIVDIYSNKAKSPNVLLIFGSFFIVFSLMSTLDGYNYEKKLIKETELGNLSQNVFVMVDHNNTYYYFYKTSEYDNKEEFILKTVFYNVTAVESDDIEVPKLKIYKQDAKFGLWSLGARSKTVHIFEVPKGGIARNIEVK